MTCPHGTPDDRVPTVIICSAEREKSGARQEWAAANGGFILTTWWCRWRCPLRAKVGGKRKAPAVTGAG